MPDAGAGRITAPGAMGNIGGQLLGRCRVTFDYSHRRILLEPAGNFERPFETEMLGATLTRAEGGLLVRWVNPETPASEAGLEIGDLVTTLDGEAAQRVDPAMLRQRLQEPGRLLRLEIRHGAESRPVTLTLRRLL
jgi:C-terminal processing protease CtpA/Prc